MFSGQSTCPALPMLDCGLLEQDPNSGRLVLSVVIRDGDGDNYPASPMSGDSDSFGPVIVGRQFRARPLLAVRIRPGAIEEAIVRTLHDGEP